MDLSWQWRRLVNAVAAGVTTYRQANFIPTERHGHDDYGARLARYAVFDGYYNNVQYSAIESYSTSLKEAAPAKYKFIRSVYNPVYRAVEIHASKIYPGALDFEKMDRGAIPLLMASDPLKAAIRQLWLWSNWRNQKALYVRGGALYGDNYIQLVDEPLKRKVRMEVLHPGRVAEQDTDGAGNIKRILLRYQKQDENGGWYWYGLEVDQESFKTFKNDKPFAFQQDERGVKVNQWDNIYGFVPFVHTQYTDVGLGFGANIFHAQLPKIDELNDAASVLFDQVRKSVQVLWYLAGKLAPMTETDASVTDKDKIKVLQGPEGSAMTPLVAPIDIAAASANYEKLITELERDLPELALQRIRETSNLTKPGVEAAFSDGIDRLDNGRGTCDDGLIRAQKMGVTIGGIQGYDGFEAFDITSFEKGDLEHFIGERDIIKDQLTKLETVQALQSAGASIQLIMEQMDFDQQTIEEEVARKEQAARDAMRAFAESTFGGDEDDEDDDEEPTAATEANAEEEAQARSIAA